MAAPGNGPVTLKIKGGTKLEAALAKIAVKLKKHATLEVGFLEDATYPDGTSIALVAAVQNWGAPSRGIPPRPFFTNMVKENSPSWPEMIGKLLPVHDYDTVRVLELMGEELKGELQQSIIDTNEPPLAQATIDHKGFEKPLIEYGDMINSVDWNVNT